MNEGNRVLDTAEDRVCVFCGGHFGAMPDSKDKFCSSKCFEKWGVNKINQDKVEDFYKMFKRLISIRNDIKKKKEEAKMEYELRIKELEASEKVYEIISQEIAGILSQDGVY